MKHYHLFLFGANFTLITDHNLLEVIYGSPKSKPSARIKCWVLRLQPYDSTVQVQVYRSGTDNSADYMSRHLAKSSTRKQEHIIEAYVNFVARNAVPKAITLAEIQQATNNDQTMKGLRASIRLNQWDNDIVKPYKSVKYELTVTSENIILRGTRIVIPESLQQKAIELAHESHQGLAKTKALLREKIWLPGVDKATENMIDRCIICQSVGKPNPPQPLTMSKMPDAPWDKVYVDFYGPLPSGEYLLVVIDKYSRYPEVEIIRSTRASVVIPKLDKIFAIHGIPSVVKADNGPSFNSDDFERYLNTLGKNASPQLQNGHNAMPKLKGL